MNWIFFLFFKLIKRCFLTSSIILLIKLVSIIFGSAPLIPITTAKSVPCPLPVLAKEPYNLICIFSTFCKSFRSSIWFKQCNAASQGPKVWELDGPTPILNISNTDINFSIILDKCMLVFNTFEYEILDNNFISTIVFIEY